MTIPFCFDIPPLYDIEGDVDASLEWEHGEPVVSVSDVIIDGMSLLIHDDPLVRQIGGRIAHLARNDDDILEQLLEDEGVSYRGGPNNPEGHWRVAR